MLLERDNSKRSSTAGKPGNHVPLRSKIEEKKALEVLGIEPSKEKVTEVLGMGEEQWAEFMAEKVENELEKVRILESKKHEKKKEEAKALETLGRDPSKEKVTGVLGVTKKQWKEIVVEQIERVEKEMKSFRYLQSIIYLF